MIALKDDSKAMSAFQKALELDPNNYDAREGLQKCYAADDPETRRKRALQNPEIQQIMADPAMQMILQQMQENPSAIKELVFSLLTTPFSCQPILLLFLVFSHFIVF